MKAIHELHFVTELIKFLKITVQYTYSGTGQEKFIILKLTSELEAMKV